jgi:hypothetical protein
MDGPPEQHAAGSGSKSSRDKSGRKELLRTLTKKSRVNLRCASVFVPKDKLMGEIEILLIPCWARYCSLIITLTLTSFFQTTMRGKNCLKGYTRPVYMPRNPNNPKQVKCPE